MTASGRVLSLFDEVEIGAEDAVSAIDESASWLRRRWMCVRGRYADGTRNVKKQVAIIVWLQCVTAANAVVQVVTLLWLMARR